MSKPLCIDLFCGLGGWAEGFLAEGYDVIGFDIERHDYGTGGYPGQLVLQDVLTLHGSQFSEATVIVASPPCQEFSYMAMPWKRAKQIAAALRGEGEFPKNYRGSRTVRKLCGLFDACLRLQREAADAQDCDCGHPEEEHEHDYLNGDDVCGHCSCISISKRHIPLIVENVRGAQPWVGSAAWSFGSYYLWGDIPALMPAARSIAKCSGQDWNRFKQSGHVSPHWRIEGLKTIGHINKRDGYSHTRHLTNSREHGIKQYGSGKAWFDGGIASMPSNSARRKAASAQIAKIPFPLAQWIAQYFKPSAEAGA